MNLTNEQEEIISSVKRYRNIKINAFAGTGKTTTLKLVANEYKQKKILYLAFNSAIKNEASAIFPNNTYVKTTHGLAYSAIKKYTNIDLSNLVNYRAIDISKEFGITYNQAVSTLKIFENFCNNTKDSITKDDIEHKTAKKMFDNMMIGVLKPTHSFYLKYYYLLISKEQIPQYSYDIVMLDEAQDTNKVTLGIFESLSSYSKIYVGDKHQQIYSFRGSQNALSKIKCDVELYLSKSFRFNDGIASYANILLENFRNEEVKIESHLDKSDTKVLTNGYISRTNASLISVISNRCDDRKPFVTVRNPDEIFSLSIELYYLLNNERDQIRKNRFLKDFKSEEEVNEYAKEVDDFELKSALKVVKEYKENIFTLKDIAVKFYKAWQNRALNGFDKRLEEILFLTTAHTAKGLEWDRVIIADDFTDFADLIFDLGCSSLKEYQESFSELLTQELMDEFNLFYVAITRSKKVLVKDSENFHYLMANDLEKLIDIRLKDAQENYEKASANQDKKKKVSLTKLEKEDKQSLQEQKNLEAGKAKKSGMKWSLEDKIKLKQLFNKEYEIPQIASKLERSNGAILGELLKSELITRTEQITLSKLLKEQKVAKRGSLAF